MPVKLYVDNFSPDGSIAVTTEKVSVSYNLIVLNRFNEENSPVFTVGKYLAIIWASDPPSITFIDLRRSPSTVQQIINAPEFADKKAKFISMLEMHNATYESTKDYIELEKGLPPNATPLDENDH
jgi:hypothetical protein